MFNNTAFDVVIGMVLIYLLYSLLVTVVGEMLSTWMAMRSRILRVAIEKMLNDGYLDTKGQWRYNNWWHFAQRFFLKEFEGFKDSFAGKFYQQASIKYLSNRVGEKITYFSQTKPSYISDTNFADTLVAMLTGRGQGNDDMAKIAYCLTHNLCLIQPQTRAHLQRLMTEAAGDITVFKTKLKQWFNETNDRATGWYKRKMQLILFWVGFILAAAFNVDSIAIAKFLAKDKEARNNLTSMAVAVVRDSVRYQPLLNRNGDSLMPKEVFDSSMALVKRDIKQANLILGLGWGLDTMTKQGKICFSKENDSAAYYQLLQSGRLLNDTIRPLRRMVAKVDSLKRKITRERKKLAGYLAFVKDSMAQVVLPDSVAVAKIRLDTTQKSVLLDSMALAQRSDTLAGLDTLLSNAFREIRTLTARRLVSIEHIDSSQREKGKLVVHGRTTYNIIDKIWYVTCQLFKDRLRLLGLIITALMLSLGAPFWFDLLKKLVSLRGAGVKPEEKKPPTAPTGGGANNTVPQPGEGGDNVRLLAAVPVAPLHNVNAHTTDPAEQALDSLTQQLAGHAGVVAIGLKPQPGQPPSMALEVMVKDQATADALAQQPGNTQKLSNGTTMPIVYTMTGANLFHGGKMGSEIGNQTGTLGQGTLGCFLQRQDSNQQFMLSCWHVMKDNANWAEPPLQKTIVQNSQPIGTITDGCLTDTIDVGIAAFTSPPIEKNPDIVITAQHRAVKAFDALVSTPVKLYGKVSKLQQAQVFHHKINAQLEYPGNTIHNFVDVFSISVKDSSTGAFSSPTAPGDSGAVVTDLNGVPLGMVVGGNNTFTYVVKFTNVFNPGMPYSDYSFIVNA